MPHQLLHVACFEARPLAQIQLTLQDRPCWQEAQQFAGSWGESVLGVPIHEECCAETEQSGCISDLACRQHSKNTMSLSQRGGVN